VRLPVDLHTHTVSSGHAYSTVREIVATAAHRGMEMVAITDHGPALPGGPHEYHFRNLKALPAIIDGVRVLKGVEANIVGDDGALDLPDEILERLDIVAVALHPGSDFEGGDISRNTKALLGAIAHPMVDMITHPGNQSYPVDIESVVEAARENDVIVELNDFSFSGNGSRQGSEDAERRFVWDAHEAGVPIAINSDAHYHLQVGIFQSAGPVARDLGLCEEDFINSSADRVLEFLLAKRSRPLLDIGGEW